MGTDTGKERTILTGEPRGRNGPGRRKHRAARARWSAIKGAQINGGLSKSNTGPSGGTKFSDWSPTKNESGTGSRQPATVSTAS